MNDAFILQARRAEVQKQAYSQPGGAQVVQALGSMNPFQALYRLEFDDDATIYQQVGQILTHNFPFVSNFDGVLLRNAMTSAAKLDRQRILVHLLEEA